jgi:phosphatidylglycerophosphate synthase
MTWKSIAKFIPWLLVLSRAAIAPYLLWDAGDQQTGALFMGMYSWAFFSDIFDGIIARRLQMSSKALRVADSIADTLLYISVAICTWLTHPDLIIANQVPLLSVVGGMGLWIVINLAKYGRLASYHTYSAKIWGLALFAATIGIYTGWHSTALLLLACGCGLLNIAEEILMTMVLPIWHHDVLSLAAAWKLRQSYSPESIIRLLVRLAR